VFCISVAVFVAVVCPSIRSWSCAIKIRAKSKVCPHNAFAWQVSPAYRNYNPIVYYQNYRVKHYRPTVYVTPRYRNVDVRTFKNDAYRTGGFRNNDRAYNDNRNFEKSRENSGFRSGSSEERPRDNGGFRSSDSRNDNDRNYGNQNQQPSRNEGFRSVSPQRSENQNRGNDAVRSGGFRSQGQENKVE
jgi:hypothetical protein